MNREKIRTLPVKVVGIACIGVLIIISLASIRQRTYATQREQGTVFAAEAAQTERQTEKQEPVTEEITEPVTEEATEKITEAQTEARAGTYIASRDWGADDAEILLKIAMAEAEGEPVEGKALVMLVVLNRVWTDGFPGTIRDVVFEKGQFSPTAEGGRYWTTEPNEECYEALRMVEQGWDESEGALYFEACGGDCWQSRNLEYLFQVGNHRFYR